MQTFALPLAAALVALAGPALARDCPAAVPFGPGDSLAQLSARCGVPAERILRANDVVDEEALRQAGAVAVPLAGDEPPASEPEAAGLLDRAQDLARDTAREAGGVAAEAGEAVSGYLSQNDPARDLLELGKSAGVPGIEAEPRRGPDLAATTLEGDRLRIAATGLPGNRKVQLSLIHDGQSIPLTEATTDGDGVLMSEVRMPDLSPAGEASVALETAEGNLRITSDPLDLR
ncbi:LysM peptidoglycan-binding domain-containing protein [Paracoccus sp. T5]|uniref:LysM peptidoglycan-binding domain-containing protein n=1 Tax=Paracoccus sp. T5 TaxID=3402161 RepID=UPI003AE05788